MKKINLILFIILLFASSSMAQDLNKSEIYGQPDPGKISIPKINEQKDVLYFSDEVLKDYDPTLGIMSDSFSTLRDRNRFSLGYHLATDYNDFTKVTSFEIEFLQNNRAWDNSWWGFLFKTGSATFEAISKNHDTKSGASSDSNANSSMQRPDDANQNFTLFGLGIGYRFRFLLDFVKTERLYEQSMIYLAYLNHSDDYTKLEYSGPAAVMDYQIFKRSSHRVYYGAKLSYNLASVTTDIADGIRNREARLTLSWLSIGFSVGYFY